MRAPYRFITYGWLDMILGGDGALYPSGHGPKRPRVDRIMTRPPPSRGMTPSVCKPGRQFEINRRPRRNRGEAHFRQNVAA